MFGKKNKPTSIKYVVVKNGLPNFVSDAVAEVLVDKSNRTITFVEGKKNGATATLSIDKIIRMETGTTIGAIPKAQVLQTMNIIYSSTSGEGNISLCETNNYGASSFNLLKTLIQTSLQTNAPQHVEL